MKNEKPIPKNAPWRAAPPPGPAGRRSPPQRARTARHAHPRPVRGSVREESVRQESVRKGNVGNVRRDKSAKGLCKERERWGACALPFRMPLQWGGVNRACIGDGCCCAGQTLVRRKKNSTWRYIWNAGSAHNKQAHHIHPTALRPTLNK